ncbi:MAG: bifunctional UDP-N-acetylglucosamine diphosphorylase/glucosamine-1-phosphate N-acetyltransferase GlmU [Elusimicrobiota bacterium]|jgi:bifunctional UDP-N-acetylglucosamine pyrophosphorylase/glucosamine-1-phosphate N-acetyltransferase|nr:bifunctional UDP-N-acetylglucosamine diphosphorylase/glucosamine-1-phosphate N-acetyltransferase GlmU [Elusimicrobiota bacterium]
MNKFSAVILAAGAGSRMKSSKPKVLQEISGKPLIKWVIDAISPLNPDKIVIVVGHKAELVESALAGIANISFAHQKEQLGSANALESARDLFIDYGGDIVVLSGDVPLIKTQTLKSLLDQHEKDSNSITVLGAKVANPFGYGRIVQNNNEIIKIVEQKDASPDEQKIDEINSGIYCFDKNIWTALSKVKPNNAKNEYYITDTLAILKDMGLRAGLFTISDDKQILGVNDMAQLAQMEAIAQNEKIQELFNSGVKIIDPKNVYISWDAKIGQDTIIYPQVFVSSNVSIGKNCQLMGSCFIKNSKIADDVIIKYSYVDGAQIERGVQIGPFSHLRPQTVLGENVKVGNFSEVKKSVINENSKVNHLSYIGDAEIGKNVNIGAGTITCNYDGSKKHKTIIGDNSFIGSNVNFVAPIKIHEDVLIAAGSTITADVKAGDLAIARSRQRAIARKISK